MEEESFLQAPQELATAALAPDGEILAWFLVDHTLQLIRLADGHLLKTIKAHTQPVLKLSFFPTGDRLFSASYDTWVRIWDRNGQPVDAIQPTAALDLPNDIQGIGISPDGRMLGSIPFDGPAKIYDLATKKEVANLGGTGGDVSADIAFSPDGEFVAADQLGRLSLWRTLDWKVEWTGTSSVAFAFSPAGRLLAYSDADDSYKVFLRSLTETEETRLLEGDQTVPGNGKGGSEQIREEAQISEKPPTDDVERFFFMLWFESRGKQSNSRGTRSVQREWLFKTSLSTS